MSPDDPIVIRVTRDQAKYIRCLINGNEGELNGRGWGHATSAKYEVYKAVSDAIDDRDRESHEMFWPSDLTLDGTEIERCIWSLKGGEANGYHYYQCGRLAGHDGPHKAFRRKTKECFLEEEEDD